MTNTNLWTYQLSRWFTEKTNKTSGTSTTTYYITKADNAFGTIVHVHVSCRTKSSSGVITFKIGSAGDGLTNGTVVSFVVALVNGRTDSFECDFPIYSLHGEGGNASAGIIIEDKMTGNGAAHFTIEVRVA